MTGDWYVPTPWGTTQVGDPPRDHVVAAHDWLERPLIFWTPTHSGVTQRHLLAAKFGKRFTKWFATIGMGTLKDRLTSASVHWLARRAAG